jgi:aspartokinase
MIYFTKDALRVIKQKFFYLELADGCKAIVYKQDKSKAQEALKKEKYKLKFSFYSMLDKTNIDEEKDVYLLGVGNKNTLQDKVFKILAKEKLNILYIGISSMWKILFLSEKDIQKEKYANSKTENSMWRCAVANEESVTFLKTKLKPERELAEVAKILNKIEEN